MGMIAIRILSRLRHVGACLLFALALLPPWRWVDAKYVSSPAERRTVGQRIEAIREELRLGHPRSDLREAESDDTAPPRTWPQRIGQWYNWPNWPNWGNWNNWNNWGNWRNF